MPAHRVVILALFAAFLLIVAIDHWRKKKTVKTPLIRPPASLEAPDPEPRPNA
jgi:hypothetical protein